MFYGYLVLQIGNLINLFIHLFICFVEKLSDCLLYMWVSGLGLDFYNKLNVSTVFIY